MRRIAPLWLLLAVLVACGDDPPAPAPAPATPTPPAAQPAVPEPAPAVPEPSGPPPGLAPAPEWAAPRASASGRPSVLLLGIDGADWDVLDPLFAAGYLPNLARLARGGVRAALDCTPAMPETACFCPPVWVTIASGVTHARHQIAIIHHEVGERKAAVLWDVLDSAGGTTTLVAYRNTWPPEDAARYVLTEYGLDWAAGEIHRRLPPDPRPPLKTLLPDYRFAPKDLLEQLGLLPHEGAQSPAWRMVARDRVSMEALLRLAPKDRTDLTAVLLHSPDKAEHLGWAAVQPTPADPVDGAAIVAQARAWRGPVRARRGSPGTDVASQYLEIDAWLGALLSRVPYDVIVVASDHGMTRNPGEGLAGHHGIEAPEGHEGVLILWGEGVREGAELAEVSVLDVAPTLAHVLELPVATDLPGRVLLDAFTPDWREAHPVETVPSWEVYRPKIPGSRSTPTGQ